MEWIERINDVEGRLTPVYATRDGQRSYGSLKQCKTRMKIRGYQAAVVRDLPLHSLRKVSARAYLSAMEFEGIDPDSQEVFVADHEGVQIFIPTSTLLLALVSRMRNFGEHLLAASSMAALMRPIIRDGTLSVALPDRFLQTKVAQLPGIQARLIWLTSFLSARKMWSSVHDSAKRGVFGMQLPQAAVDAAVVGIRREGVIYASRLSIKELRPNEEPLPFAAGYVPTRFTFVTEVGQVGLKAFQATGNHASITSDNSIPCASHGWAMTTEEWRQVLHLLKKRGYRIPFSAKANLDMALEKYGRGIRWRDVDGNYRSAQTVTSRWKASGKWEQIMAALRETRVVEPEPAGRNRES